MGLAALLRLADLGGEALWLDEAFSWRWAHLPHAEIWGDAARTETNPPLYFSLQRLALALGEGEAALRLPAALLGIATVPLAHLLGTAVAGPRAGLLVALLVATAPLQIAYAQEARGYTLLGAAALLALAGMAMFCRASAAGASASGAVRPRAVAGLAAYALGVTVALYTHHTALLVPVLGNIGALWWWLARAGRNRRLAALWLLANLVPAVAWLWWLPVLLEQMHAANVAWIRQPSPAGALLGTAILYGPHHLPTSWRLLGPLLALPLAFLMLLGLRSRQVRDGVVLLLVVAAGAPVLTWLAGLVLRPLWLERTLLWSHLAGLVAIGVGLGTIRRARLRTLAVGALVAVSAADLAGYYRGTDKVPMREVAARVAAVARPGDAVALAPHYVHWVWAYYAPRAGLEPTAYGVVTGPPPPPGAPAITAIDRGLTLLDPAGLATIAPRFERLWLLTYKRARGRSGDLLETLAQVAEVDRIDGWLSGEVELFRIQPRRSAGS